MKSLLGALVVGFAALLLIAGCGGSCDGTSVRRGDEMICVPRNQSTNYGEGTPFSDITPPKMNLPLLPDEPFKPAWMGQDFRKPSKPEIPGKPTS